MGKRPPVRERLVFHIWDGQHLSKAGLQTEDHRSLVVRHPGTWNSDAGPDFEDAELVMDGRVVWGDVEIHTSASGWHAHQHHLDPRYNSVVLHAVLWDDGQAGTTVTQSGDPVPVLVMGRFLDESLEKLSRRMARLDRSKARGTCPRAAEIRQAAADRIVGALDDAAEQRWHQKAAVFRRRFGETQSWEQTLYEGLMGALGYAKNKRPFVELARRMPLAEVQAALGPLAGSEGVEELRALLFGIAGLLPSQSRKPVPLDLAAIDYVAALEHAWQRWTPRYAARQMEPTSWQFFRLRPANFPTRRLAGMAQLLLQSVHTGLLSPFLEAIEPVPPADESPWTALEGRLTPPMDDYWRNHYHFGRSTTQDSGRAIGPDRARDMVVNVVLPILWLCTRERADTALSEGVWGVYEGYPKLAPNSLTRFVTGQALPRRVAAKLVCGAMRQQGALQVYRTACETHQCETCVFLR